MPEFTTAQKEAIKTLGKDIIVTAAAGSGKTAVLSERVLNLIMNENADITDFLIVTFTNAAAAEMKNRIGEKISSAIAGEGLSPSKKRHLNKQLSLLGRADITTIHSFCLSVIKSNFYHLDIDPKVRTIEAGEAELMKISAAEDMLEEMYSGQNPETFSNLCRWLGGGNDDALCAQIIDLHKFISSFSYPSIWLDTQIEKYNPETLEDIDSLDWITELKTSYKLKFEGLASRSRSIYNVALDNGITAYADTFAKDAEALSLMAEYCDKSWDELCSFALDFSFSTLGRKNKNDDETITERLKSSREQIKKSAVNIVQKICKMSASDLSYGLGKMYPLLLSLGNAVSVYDRIYSEKKRAASAIDFNDYEHFCLKVLRDKKNGVADKLSQKYKYILVDEYQDCNPIQEELFSHICRKENGESSNMFMVGDIKQSIYKFRQADPEIFINKSILYGEASSSGKRITLNKNFRSSNSVLNYVNHVFSRIMSTYIGEMEYTDEDKLYYREDNAPPVSDRDRCEILLASAKENEDVENKYELEAKVIASRIAKLVQEGYKYKDIVVLYRSMGQKSDALEEEFKACGIPYYLDSNSGYFETLEVRMFLSLLKIVDNPAADIPLAGVLRSPLFQFDENDLLKIRCEKKGMLIDALTSYSTKSDELAKKCSDFLNKLNTWRDTAISKTVPEFVGYLLDDSGIDVFALGLPGGITRKANLHLMVEYAKGFSKASSGGLFGFVKYMQRLKSHGDTGGAKTLSESSNVVRIMTIHKSKGLEFPVVFLASCHAKFYEKDLSGNLILHRKLGLGLEMYDFDRRVHSSLISKEAIKEKLRIENISEEMRVMYVAMTRAKNKLICTGVVKDAEAMIDNWKQISYGCEKLPLSSMIQFSSYLDWLVHSLTDEITLTLSPEITAESGAATLPSLMNFDDVTISEDIKNRLEYKYPYISSSYMPTKFSVSELKRRFDFDDALSAKLQPSTVLKSSTLDEDKTISPTQSGIINHLVLRHINLEKTSAEDICICCDKLVSSGLLRDDELQAVNTDAIARFFETPLGKRLANAQKVYREESFNILVSQNEISGDPSACNDDKVLIQGIIDCMFIENGAVVVVDFKTDKFISDETYQMYKIQLDLYARAAEKITKLPCNERYLYMLNKEKTITI